MLLLNLINQVKHKYDLCIRAIHINHNISDNNEKMERLCINFCKNMGIDLITRSINLSQTTNIEEHLRNKRYELIFKSMHLMKL